MATVVIGLSDLERTFDQLGKRIGRKVAHAALREGAKPIVAEARAKAPKADHVSKKKNAKGKPCESAIMDVGHGVNERVL